MFPVAYAFSASFRAFENYHIDFKAFFYVFNFCIKTSFSLPLALTLPFPYLTEDTGPPCIWQLCKIPTSLLSLWLQLVILLLSQPPPGSFSIFFFSR